MEYVCLTVHSNSTCMKDDNECVKLTVGFVIFDGIGNALFIPFLEVLMCDVSNMKQCFENKIMSCHKSSLYNVEH